MLSYGLNAQVGHGGIVMIGEIGGAIQEADSPEMD